MNGPIRRVQILPCRVRWYRVSRGFLFCDETAKEELCRGRRSVGVIATVGVHEAVNHTLSLGELVQVNGDV